MRAGGDADHGTGSARRRWTVVSVAALAIVTALLAVSPALRFAAAHGGSGIVFHEAKDAEFYVALIRRAADGTYGHANDLLWEWSQGPGRAPPWTVGLLGLVRAWTGASPHWIAIGSSAIAAAGHVVLFFAIARTLRLSRPASLAAAAAACLAPFLWAYHDSVLWLGHPDRILTPFLPLGRPVNPSMSSLVVWGAVLALLRWLRRPAWPAWTVCAALLAAAWTTYAPAFVLLGAVFGTAAIVELLGGRWRVAAALGGAILLAGVVNFASIHELTSGAADASAAETAVSNMLSLPSRKPVVTADTVTALVLGAVWLLLNWGRRGDPARRCLGLAVPLALILVFNLQIVTGRLDQPFHYDWFYSVPLIWMMTAVLAADLRAHGPAVSRFLAPAGRMRIAQRVVGVVALVAIALCLGGKTTGSLLKSVGLLRGDAVAQPWLRAGYVIAAGIVTLCVLRWIAAHRWRRLTLAASAAVLVLAVLEGRRIQDHEYAARERDVAARAPLAAALAKLSELSDPDDVILCADDTAARWVPSYTGRRVLISYEVQFFPVPPDDEFRRRRYVQLALFGLPPDVLAAALGDEGRWHSTIFKWRTFAPPSYRLAILSYGVHAAPLAPGDDARAAAAYREVAARPRRELLREFRVDWVLWRDAPDTSGLRDPGPGDGLELAWEGDGARIYRVQR